jgi:hypothetical protein
MPTSLSIVQTRFPSVMRVVKAKRDLTIEITKTDARIGQKKDHSACVVAEACKKKLHLDGCIISMQSAYLIRGDIATRYKVPEGISRELVSFDRGAGFAPGEYTLKVPPVRIAHAKPKRATSRGKTVSRRHGHKVTSGVRAPLVPLQ